MTWSLLDSGTAGFSDGNTGHVFSYPAGAPNPGDLLILAISSDTTVSTPSGWALAVSDVHNIGAYLLYRVAQTSEASSVTITTSGNFPTAAGFLRYSGSTSTPLDVTASAFHTTSASATPAVTSPGLAQTGELVVAAGCLGGLQNAAQTGITWSSGYTGQLNGSSGGTGATDQRVLVGDTRNAGTAAESPSVSWTNATNNQTILVATFLPGAGATPKSSSDSASGTDTAAISATFALSETGAGTDSIGAFTAAISAPESAAGTETAGYSAAAATVDTAAGSESALVQVIPAPPVNHIVYSYSALIERWAFLLLPN